MKINKKCYATVINTSKTGRIRIIILRYKLKRLGFIKNDPEFIKRYGLESIDNCEVWSRSLKEEK